MNAHKINVIKITKTKNRFTIAFKGTFLPFYSFYNSTFDCKIPSYATYFTLYSKYNLFFRVFTTDSISINC